MAIEACMGTGHAGFEIEDIGGKMKAQNDDALLTPAEVAALFRVDPKTVTRWAKAGKLSSIRTLGGHRRYRAEEVKKFLEGAMQGR
jgi:excisionase family DNA binding protein